MKKKRYVLVVCLILVLVFIFFYLRANKGYPRKTEIKSYGINDTITFGNVDMKVTSTKLSTNREYLNIDIEYTSRLSNINIAKAGLIPKLHQNFTESYAENLDEGRTASLNFKPLYKINDFSLKKGEKKKFTLIYPVYDKGDYTNALLINPDLYKEIKKEKYKNGFLYYEIIDLGDIYDQGKFL